MRRINKFYIVITTGILFSCVLYLSYHYDNLLRHFFYLLFGGIGMYTFYNEFFDKSGSSKDFEILKKSSTIIFGSLILLINISIFCYYEMKLNSKTLIKVENHGVSADFKKSGEYIIKSGSWASKKYFYGKYSIKDSIITVDRDYFNDVLVTNTFLIRRIENAFNKNDPNKIKNYLVELDKRGKEINNGYLFEIVKDNRK